MLLFTVTKIEKPVYWLEKIHLCWVRLFQGLFSVGGGLRTDYKEALDSFSVGHLEQIAPCVRQIAGLTATQEQGQTEKN